MDCSIDISSSVKISQLPRAHDLSGRSFLLSRHDGRAAVSPDIYSLLADERDYTGLMDYLSQQVASGFMTEEEASRVLLQLKYVSRRIQYEDLSSRLAEGISSMLHLSSMAFMDKSEYSTIGHTHEYQFVRFPSSGAAYTSGVYIGALSVSYDEGLTYRTLSIYAPEFSAPDYSGMYDIGEMKLLAVGNRQQYAYTNTLFDGWVYLDGARYPKSQFPEAWELYKNMSGSNLTSFVVPNIKGFVVPCGSSGNPLSSHGWTNRLPAHTHSGIDSAQFRSSQFDNLPVRVAFKYYDTGTGDSLHTRYTREIGETTYTISNIHTENMKFMATTTEAMTNQEIESYPDHVKLPAMVYIGIPMSRRSAT